MSENKCNLEQFTSEIIELCKKHNVLLGGKLRLLNQERYISQSQNVKYSEIIVDGVTTDRTGPFLFLDADLQPYETVKLNPSTKLHAIIDYDKPLRKGVVNPIDGKKYDTRHQWNETLKRNNCHQAETSVPENRKITADDMRGNHNVRKELTLATREVLEKQGLR